MSAVWISLLLWVTSAYELEPFQEPRWHIIALTFGTAAFVSIFAASFTFRTLPPKTWRIPTAVNILAFVVAAFVTISILHTVSIWETVFAIVTLALGILFCFAFPIMDRFSGRPNPARLLGDLNLTLPEACSLTFLHAGGPTDADSHRKRYFELVEENKAASARMGIQPYPSTAYARVIKQDNDDRGLIAIQYWLAYFYNDWANNHEMDWEQITVFLRRKNAASEPAPDDVEPIACGLSQHFAGAALEWHTSDVPNHHGPVAYVARGSHANYPQPGRYRPVSTFAGLRFTGKDLGLLGQSPDRYMDVALPGPERSRGRTVSITPEVVTLPPEPDRGRSWAHAAGCRHEPDDLGVCRYDFRWLNMRGYWGSPGRLFAGDNAPESPPEQQSWIDPFFWFEECEKFDPPYGRKLLEGGGGDFWEIVREVGERASA
jgi:hypothetical protein